MKKIASLVIAFTFLHGQLTYALPVKNNATNGVQFDKNQNTLNITAPDKSVINYDSFNIAANEAVNFVQPGSSASVLNRVLSGGASVIDGALAANGNILLVNPSGVMFGGGATVNANSFIASTKNITDANFQAGLLKFEGSTSGKIVNSGLIQGSKNVGLIAANIENKGTIKAGKNAGLIAGNTGSVTVDFEGNGLVNFAADSSTIGSGTITNSGTIKAGQVLLTANDVSNVLKNVINNTGTIEATKAVAGENGAIQLISDASVKNTGHLKAPEGQITINTGGDMNSEGTISAVDGEVAIEAVGDVTSSGTLEAGKLTEKGATFGISGTFSVDESSLANDDSAITFSGDTTLTGNISDVDNIIVSGGVTLTLAADVTLTAGAATSANTNVNDSGNMSAGGGAPADGDFIWMDDTAVINGAGFNLTFDTKGANSWLTSINGVKDLTFLNGNADKVSNTVTYELKKDITATGTFTIGEGTSLNLYPIDGANAAIDNITFTADTFAVGGTGANAGSIKTNNKNLTLDATSTTTDSAVNFFVTDQGSDTVYSTKSLTFLGKENTKFVVGVANNDTATGNKILVNGITLGAADRIANVELQNSIAEISSAGDAGNSFVMQNGGGVVGSKLILNGNTTVAGRTIQMYTNTTIDAQSNNLTFWNVTDGGYSNLALLQAVNAAFFGGTGAGGGSFYNLQNDVTAAGTLTVNDGIRLIANTATDMTITADSFVANGAGEVAGAINANNKNLTLSATSAITDSVINLFLNDQANDVVYNDGALIFVGDANTKFTVGVANNDTANGNKLMFRGITVGSGSKVANVEVQSSIAEILTTAGVGGNLTIRNASTVNGSTLTLSGNTVVTAPSIVMEADTTINAGNNDLTISTGGGVLAGLSNVKNLNLNDKDVDGTQIQYEILESIEATLDFMMNEDVKVRAATPGTTTIKATNFGMANNTELNAWQPVAPHGNLIFDVSNTAAIKNLVCVEDLTLTGGGMFTLDAGITNFSAEGNFSVGANTHITLGNNVTFGGQTLTMQSGSGVTGGGNNLILDFQNASSVYGAMNGVADLTFNSTDYTLNNDIVINGALTVQSNRTLTLNKAGFDFSANSFSLAGATVDAGNNAVSFNADANSTLGNFSNLSTISLNDKVVDAAQIQYELTSNTLTATGDVNIGEDVKVRASNYGTPTVITAANFNMANNTELNAWQDTANPATPTHGDLTLNVNTAAAIGTLVCVDDLTLTGGGMFTLGAGVTTLNADSILTIGPNTYITLGNNLSVNGATLTMQSGSGFTGAGHNLAFNLTNASSLYGALNGVADLTFNNTTYTLNDGIVINGNVTTGAGVTLLISDAGFDMGANSFDLGNAIVNANGNNIGLHAAANSTLGAITNANNLTLDGGVQYTVAAGISEYVMNGTFTLGDSGDGTTLALTDNLTVDTADIQMDSAATITAADKNLILKSENNSRVYDINLGAGDLTFQGTGATAATFSSTGTLTCSNANTPTLINAILDTLVLITAADAGWSLDGTTMVYSGDWTMSSGNYGFENTVTGIRVDAGAGSGLFNFTGGALTLGNIVSFITAGNFSLGNNIALTFTKTAPTTITVGGDLNMGTNSALTVAGDTTVTANLINMSGTSTVNAGNNDLILKAANNSNIGNLAAVDALDVNKKGVADTPTYTQLGNIASNSFNLNAGVTFVSDTSKAFAAAQNFILADGSTFKRFAGGDGASAATAYQIVDVYGLQAMECDLAADYTLNNNIDATMTSTWDGGKGFNPIGEYVFLGANNSFTGDFDGQNFNINGLYVNRTADSRVGLFTATDGAIKNLKLSNATVIGNTYAGALVGLMNGSVDNCSVSSGSVKASSTVGGLIGYADGSSVNNSSAAVTVEAQYAPSDTFPKGTWAGGLIGVSRCDVANSHATGNVTGRGFIGGLVGFTTPDLPNKGISNSYAAGNVTGLEYVGGLVGYNDGHYVDNSEYKTGTITGTFSVGGLIGQSLTGTDTNGDDAIPVYTDNKWNSDTANLDYNQDIGNLGNVDGITDLGTDPATIPATPATPSSQGEPATPATPATPAAQEPEPAQIAQIVAQVKKQVQLIILDVNPEIPSQGAGKSAGKALGQIKKILPGQDFNLGSLISSFGSIVFGQGLLSGPQSPVTPPPAGGARTALGSSQGPQVESRPSEPTSLASITGSGERQEEELI